MVEYWSDDRSSLSHIFGGDPFEADGVTPSEVHQNYLDASCNWIVEEDGFDLPVYLAWNNRDILAKNYNGEAFSAALDAAHPGRYGHHDYDHNSPGGTFHSQTRNSPLPYGYTTELMLRFLEGSNVVWQEAELGCAGGIAQCPIGLKKLDQPTTPWADHSLGGGIEATAPMGAGVVYVGGLPGEVPTGRSVTATIVMGLTGLSGLAPTDDMLTVTYTDSTGVSATATFEVSDLQPDGAVPSTGAAAMINQYKSTELTFTPGDRASGVLTVEYEGRGTLRLDAIGWNWR
jgi:hypothetical protein